MLQSLIVGRTLPSVRAAHQHCCLECGKPLPTSGINWRSRKRCEKECANYVIREKMHQRYGKVQKRQYLRQPLSTGQLSPMYIPVSWMPGRVMKIGG